MIEVSSLHIRIVTIVAAVSIVLFTYLGISNVIPYDQQVATARTWNYLGTSLPIWALATYYISWNLLALIAVLGIFWFSRAARLLLAATVIAAIAFQPLSGLLVMSAIERTIWTVTAVSMTWLVTVCFWSPASSLFKKTR